MPSKRFPANETATVEQYGSGNQVPAHVTNLSNGGAFLEWQEQALEIAPGDLVRLTINLKEVGKTRNVNAVVRWLKQKRNAQKADQTIGIGVSFIKPEQVLDHLMGKF